MNVIKYRSLDALPSKYRVLLTQGEQQSFYYGLSWFKNLEQNILEGKEGISYAVEDAQGKAILLFVMRESCQRSGILGIRELSGLENYYSSLYGPAVEAGKAQITQALQLLALEIVKERPHYHVINLQPLDRESHVYGALIKALHFAGFHVQTYFCFGNWYHELSGESYQDYFSGLSSRVRNTINRKTRKFNRQDTTIKIYVSPADVNIAVRDYEKIYNSSWKQPEPYPDFIQGLVTLAAERGWLRLGIAYLDNEPVAAQIWIVCSGVASIYKLAYDEKYAKLSAGTILTAKLMEYVIDRDHVRQVDYLTGDDAYKKEWMSARRERWGVIGFNSKTLNGKLLAIRHIGASSLKRLLKKQHH